MQQLADQGIRVADLTYYRVRADDGQQGIVLGYGAATTTQLDRAITVIIKAVTSPAPRG